ncbi:DNA translocase FtsK [Sporomusaceae bacterium FL31]|nr:DNA translocase FtsK [Sporomusaceae bacterium FL31]GCE35704.1 DNA translocase FtsK [Sporomusaceae bacterium]
MEQREMIQKALEYVKRLKEDDPNSRIKIAYLQRKFIIGYTPAAKLMDELECMGVVAPYDGTPHGRTILI